MTIERLRGALAAVGLPTSARELTEILWLACQLTAEQATSGGATAGGHTSDQRPGQPGVQEGSARGASRSLTDEGAVRTSETGEGTAAQELYADAGTDGHSFDASTVQVPTAPMLHNTLAIQRALRPLKRKVASHRTDALDEDATVRRIAEQPPRHRRWLPVMQPSLERWLNLALVVDTGPSMWIWQPLARELQEALTRLGAFRDLRIWYLNGEAVATTLDGPPQRAAALLDPSGRQACLVFSDCSGVHWWNGSALRALHLWGQNGPTAILQPLAERLWRRTAIPPVPGLAQARRPAAPNIELLFTPHDASPGHGIPVPVMEISPLWLADWARLIAGPSGPALSMAAAYVKPMISAEPLLRERDLSIIDRVQRFQATASPEAARLAAYVAVSVPTLPVMRLIHHQLLPNPQPSHLAEVLLSGLLRSVEGQPGVYEFIPGACQELLATLPRSEGWYAADALSRISSEIENRAGRGGEIFRAYLQMPGRTGERALVSKQAFALISPEALRYLRRDAIAPISPTVQPRLPSAIEAHDRDQAVGTPPSAGQLLEEPASGPGITEPELGEILPAPGDSPLFRVLGPLEVWTGQGWTGVRTPRWRVLLATLLIRRGQRVSVEELATEMWGADQPARVGNLISQYIQRLRQLLGDTQRTVLITRPGGYELVLRQGDLDADRFTQRVGIAKEALAQGQTTRPADLLSEALGWWRGKALADVPPAPLVTAEADRLEEARVEAVVLQADANLACGRRTQAITELRRLVWDHPLREDLWAQLMRALMAMGRQAEALDAYNQARSVIAEELGLDPGPALQQLYTQILQSDAISAKAREAVDSLKPVAAPSQSPADIADFTGRAEETDALRRLLTGEAGSGTRAVPVVVVAGLGGAGKTALAVHTAHLLADHFPDGQLYASLGGTNQPVVPADLLARFLQALGVDPAHIPAGTEARAALYRAALAGRRVLVVLDDAANAAQVRPLLPGSPSCAVLITSRRRLHDLEGCGTLNLAVLPQDDAFELFAHVAGEERVRAEPDAAQEVLAACGGLPLAIRIAGAQLASHPSRSVRALAERLADQRNRLDALQMGNLAVRASFELSYANLLRVRRNRETDAARMFHLLGLWSGPSISLPAASALVGEPEPVAMTALEALADEHLLESLAPDRYRFHDLIRTYAAERSQTGENERSREAAIARLLNWYLHSAESAARVISAHHTRVPLSPPPRGVRPLKFASVENALAWCEAERACLVSAVGLANSFALHDVAWKLPAAAMSFFNRRSHWNDWIATHQIGLASARALAGQRAEAWMLNNLGIAYGIQRREEAIEYLRQAMALYAEIGDSQGEARTANNVATVYLDLQLFGAAFEAAQRSMEIQRRVKSRYGEGIAVGILGSCSQHSGRYDQGLDFLQKSLAIFRELEDRDAEADALADLGDTYLSLGQVSKARECLHESLVINRAIGNRYGEAVTLQRLGRAETQDGNTRQANQLLSEATRLFEELGDRAHAAEAQATAAQITSIEPDHGSISVPTNQPPSGLSRNAPDAKVRKSTLGQLSLLGEGGFSTVFRTNEFRLPDDTTPLVYKEYRTEVAAQARSAEIAIRFREELNAAERAELDSFTAWPAALVQNESGDICGCLMPEIPHDYYAQTIDPDSGRPTVTPRELQWLMTRESSLRAAQIDLPEINRHDRLALLAQLAHGLGWLHKRSWVYGGMNSKDVLFAFDPPRIILLDCDSAAPLADLDRKQTLTPFWDPPELALSAPTSTRRQTLQDTATDVYQLGLAILRCLTPGPGASSTRDVSRLDDVLDAEGVRLVAGALSTDRASRPAAREFARYLNRLLSAEAQSRERSSSATTASDQDPIDHNGGSWDIGVITVLGVETRAVKELLRRADRYRTQDGPGGHRFDEAVLTSAGIQVSVVATQALDPGSSSVYRAFDNLVRYYAPAVIVLTGLAGGVHPSVRPGDVIIAQEVVSLDRRAESSTGQQRGASWPVPASVRRAVSDFFNDRRDPHTLTITGPDGTSRTLNVFRGAVGSGYPAMVGQRPDIGAYPAHYSDRILAVETEAGGLAQAFNQKATVGTRRAGWLAISGVADHVEASKEDIFHEIPAWHAAAVLELLLPHLKLASMRFLRGDTITPRPAPVEPRLPLTEETDDRGQLAAAAARLFDLLPEAQRAAFNQLPVDRQLATLRGFSGLQLAADSATFDSVTRERIESALSTFARESTKPDGSPNLTGAVIEVTSLVETTAQAFLSRLAYLVYGNDPARIQRDLKLPTRKIRNLSLRKVVQALRTAATLEAFASVQEHISEDWLDRLGSFADERNYWAHGAVYQADARAADRAFWAMREGILIAAWLVNGIITIRDRRESPEEAEQRPGLGWSVSSYDFFLAHAWPDAREAVRLHDLLAAETSVFLAGKSIVLGDDWDRTLAEAQRQSRVTVVLISANTDTAFYQREEIAAAIDLARRGETEHRVIPVYLMPAPTDVPYGLRLKHGLVISDQLTIEQVAAQLLDLHRMLVAQAPGLVSRASGKQPVSESETTAGVTALTNASGDELVYDIRLNPVRQLLVRYIHRSADINMISIQSGLDQGSITAGGSAVNYWHEVLQRACIEGVLKVDAVLDCAIHHLKNTVGEAPLRAAVDTYRQARG